MSDYRLPVALRRDDQNRVLEALHGQNVWIEDYIAMGTDKILCHAVAVAIRQLRMFRSPKAQIRLLHEFNSRVWKDPEIASARICEPGPPNWQKDARILHCQLLCYETGDLWETFCRNCEALAYVFQTYASKDTELYLPAVRQGKVIMSLCTNWRKVRAQFPARYMLETNRKTEKGFFWRTLNLSKSDIGLTASDAVKENASIGQPGLGSELSLLAAMHPMWAMSLNGEDLPFAVAPGLQILEERVSYFSLQAEVQDKKKFLPPSLSFGLLGPHEQYTGVCVFQRSEEAAIKPQRS